LNSRFLNQRWNRRIADALREINASDAVTLDAHGAYLRLQRTRSAMTEEQRRSAGWLCVRGAKWGSKHLRHGEVPLEKVACDPRGKPPAIMA
jgi:hypothetical protein